MVMNMTTSTVASRVVAKRLLLVAVLLHYITSIFAAALPEEQDERSSQEARFNGEAKAFGVEENPEDPEHDLSNSIIAGVDFGSFYGSDFVHAFVKAILVIIVSELGDKTFFIAAIFAMKHPRVTVFLGAIGALGLMTFLSVALGYATTIIPRYVTHYVSIGLFIIFGLKMLHEGYTMDPNDSQEELEEVQAELKKKDEEMEKSAETVKDVESGVITGTRFSKLFGVFSPIFIQAFTLTFLAEWGDRSQITTIVLGASEDAFGVFLGATIGHALCTGFAVIGGRMIAQKISVRTVTLIGGCFFIGNAIFSYVTSAVS